MAQPALLALTDNGRFRIARVQFGPYHRYYKHTYRLMDKQTGISLAGGPLAHCLKVLSEADHGLR